MNRVIPKLVLAITALVVHLQPSFSASFDCQIAATKIERMVCKSKQISDLDTQLGTAYKASLESTNNSKYLIASQKQWLQKARNECSDEDCLTATYEDRLKFLAQVESSKEIATSTKIPKTFFGSYGKAPIKFCEEAENKNEKPTCFNRNFASIEPITEDRAIFSFFQIKPASYNSCDFTGIAIASTKETLVIQDLTSNENTCKINLSIKNQTLTSETTEACQGYCGAGLLFDLDGFRKIR